MTNTCALQKWRLPLFAHRPPPPSPPILINELCVKILNEIFLVLPRTKANGDMIRKIPVATRCSLFVSPNLNSYKWNIFVQYHKTILKIMNFTIKQ
jgi:hypothetical protein